MDESAKRDDLERFLVKECPAAVRHAAKRMSSALLAVDTPEDIVQQACQHAFQRIKEFQPGEHGDNSTRAWFHTIIYHVIVQAARKQLGTHRKGRKGLPQLENELLQLQADDGTSIIRQVGRTEAREFLDEAVDGLHDDWKTVIRLRYFEDLTPPEIATQLGKSITAVEGLLKRAKEALCEAMGRSSLYFLRRRKR